MENQSNRNDEFKIQNAKKEGGKMLNFAFAILNY